MRIAECFEGANGRIAESLGSGIEGSINGVHPFTKDAKAYQAKARKLIFNLNKNAVSVSDLCVYVCVCMGGDMYLLIRGIIRG
jgi:hypothetical protein